MSINNLFTGVFSYGDEKNVERISTHVNKLLNGDTAENYVHFSPFTLITDESEYNHSETFKQQYDEDTRWMAYKLIKDMYNYMRDVCTPSESYKSNSNNTTVVVNSANYTNPEKSKQILELEKLQRELIGGLTNMSNSMVNNIINWFNIRTACGYIQPFSLNEKFREELIQYVDDGYLEFKHKNNTLKESFYIDINHQQLVEYTINELHRRHVDRRFLDSWYLPTMVDLVERKDQYKQLSHKAMDSTLNTIANGIADLFRITTSLDEPNSITYTRKPLRYPFIGDTTIQSFRDAYERNKDLNPKWNEIKTPDEKMLSMFFEYADSPDKKHFAYTTLGHNLGLDRFVS